MKKMLKVVKDDELEDDDHKEDDDHEEDDVEDKDDEPQPTTTTTTTTATYNEQQTTTSKHQTPNTKHRHHHHHLHSTHVAALARVLQHGVALEQVLAHTAADLVALLSPPLALLRRHRRHHRHVVLVVHFVSVWEWSGVELGAGWRAQCDVSGCCKRQPTSTGDATLQFDSLDGV